MSKNAFEKLKVFICHSSADKPAARALYHQLEKDGFDAWLDEEKLIPGQFWKEEIPKAVKEADAIIICLSNNSITKEGYVQKEIKYALDVADEKPEGTIFIIPVKLEDCDIPYRLSDRQWVNLLFNGNVFDGNGYEKLVQSLTLRAKTSNKILPVYKKTNLVNDAVRRNTQSEALLKPKVIWGNVWVRIFIGGIIGAVLGLKDINDFMAVFILAGGATGLIIYPAKKSFLILFIMYVAATTYLYISFSVVKGFFTFLELLGAALWAGALYGPLLGSILSRLLHLRKII